MTVSLYGLEGLGSRAEDLGSRACGPRFPI